MTRRRSLLEWALAALLLVTAWCPKIRAQDSLPSFNGSWAPAVFRQWSLLYREFETEFLGCLYGEPRPDTVFVRMYVLADLPPSWSTPKESNGFCYAFSGFLGVVHSHPNGSCQFSDADLASFRWMIENRGAIVDVLVCRADIAVIHWRLPTVVYYSRCTWDPEAVHGRERLRCEQLKPPSLPESSEPS